MNDEQVVAQYIDQIDWTLCPNSVKPSLKNYLGWHIPTGGFLQAVLSNDLTGAFGKADEINRECLHDIIKFLYNEAPIIAWGSRERYHDWLNYSPELEESIDD